MDNYPNGMSHNDLIHVGEFEPEGRCYTCTYCDGGIYFDEEYVEFDGKYYHADGCFSDMIIDLSTKELAELVGGEHGTAKLEEPEWDD